jgi:hypothetical protein
VRKQYKSITQQLESGIRYFDFDVSYTYDGDDLRIVLMHGMTGWVKGYGGFFRDALQEIFDFMALHRDAVVLVRMKNVFETSVVSTLLGQELQAVVDKNGDKAVRFSPRGLRNRNPLLKDAIEKNERLFLYVTKQIDTYGKMWKSWNRLSQVETHTSFSQTWEMDNYMLDELKNEVNKTKRVRNEWNPLQIDWYVKPVLHCLQKGARMCRDTLYRLEDFNKRIVDDFRRPMNLILIDDDYESSALEMLRDVVIKINHYNVKKFGPSALAST